MVSDSASATSELCWIKERIVGGKTLRLKIANLPSDQDLTAMLAVEDKKGYIFFQEIKIELLSRAITWINGADLRKLQGKDRLVYDSRDGLQKDINRVSGNHQSLGRGLMQMLRMLLVHSQGIENSLFDSFL